MNRVRISFALLLIIAGGLFLAVEFFPGLRDMLQSKAYWPLQIIALGLVFALVAILSWMPSFWVPAAVIAGIGALLFWQNSTGNWTSWSYTWTLLPGFTGFGLLLFGLMGRKRGAYISGMWNLFSSMILFGIFASVFGDLEFAARLWPLALILLGLIIMVSAFQRRKKTSAEG